MAKSRGAAALWEGSHIMAMPEEFDVNTLQERLASLSIPVSLSTQIMNSYQSLSSRCRSGLSELVRNLDSMHVDDGRRENIVNGFNKLFSMSGERIRGEEDYQLCEILSGNFTPNQRIMICFQLLEVNSRHNNNPTFLKSVLHTMIESGRFDLIASSDTNPKLGLYMYRRLTNLCNYLKELDQSVMVEQLMTDRGVHYRYRLTGSDSHNRGHQVVILEKILGNQYHDEYAIKPHSTFMECEISKTFKDINKLVFMAAGLKKLILPTLEVEGSREPNSWGYSKFLIPDTQKDQNQATDYFTKMGALICLTKLLGIGDVHQDNLLSTDQGPVIIDLENVFDPWIMYSEDLFSTCILYALIIDQANGVRTNNYFSVNMQSCSKIFKEYSEAICTGFTETAKACKGKKQILHALLKQHYRNIRKIRIIPLSTNKFKDMQMNFLDGENIQETDGYREMLDGLSFDQLPTSYYEWGERLYEAISTGFTEGDIPYFEISMYHGGSQYDILLCNKSPICYVNYFQQMPFSMSFEKNLRFLNSESAIRQLKETLRI